MSNIDIEFGLFLAEKRKAAGLTQTEVATKLGLDQSTYGKYEKGTRTVNLDVVCRLAKILDFYPGEFFNNYGNKN